MFIISNLSFVFIKRVVISLIFQQPQRKQFAPNPNWGPYMSLFWSSQGSGKIDRVCDCCLFWSVSKTKQCSAFKYTGCPQILFLILIAYGKETSYNILVGHLFSVKHIF